MTDKFFIGQFMVNEPSIAGQLLADEQESWKWRAEWKEKIQSPNCAFFKISSSNQLALLQSHISQSTKTW